MYSYAHLYTSSSQINISHYSDSFATVDGPTLACCNLPYAAHNFFKKRFDFMWVCLYPPLSVKIFHVYMSGLTETRRGQGSRGYRVIGDYVLMLPDVGARS